MGAGDGILRYFRDGVPRPRDDPDARYAIYAICAIHPSSHLPILPSNHDGDDADTADDTTTTTMTMMTTTMMVMIMIMIMIIIIIMMMMMKTMMNTLKE